MRQSGKFVEFCRRELFLVEREPAWYANVWYIDGLSINPERCASGSVIQRFSFLDIVILGNKAAFQEYTKYLFQVTRLSVVSVHIGLHWHMMLGIIKRTAHREKSAAGCRIILRFVSAILCCYGIRAFVQRQLETYILLKSEFVFFDFGEPFLYFVFDYAAIMFLFACLGYCFLFCQKGQSAGKKIKKSF